MPDLPDPKRAPLPPPTCVRRCDFSYAELQVTSNFSFLRGASHPDELIYQAAELGYRAIAITDRNTLAGVVRAHSAAKSCGMKLVVGARVGVVCERHESTEAGKKRHGGTEARRHEGVMKAEEESLLPPSLTPHSVPLCLRASVPSSIELLLWAPDRKAYGSLCQLLTLGKKRVEKGEFLLSMDEFLTVERGLLVGVIQRHGDAEARRHEVGTREEGKSESLSPFPSNTTSCLRAFVPPCLIPPPSLMRLQDSLGDRLSLIVSCNYGDDDESYLRQMMDLSTRTGIPLLATNDVHYHDPNRRALQDVLTCVRHGCTIQEAGFRLFPNGERYLKTPEQMHRLFASCPQAIERGLEIASRCEFKLSELRYEYPDELVPAGYTPFEYLEKLTWEGVHTKLAEETRHEGEGKRGIRHGGTEARRHGGEEGEIRHEGGNEEERQEGKSLLPELPSSPTACLRAFVPSCLTSPSCLRAFVPISIPSPIASQIQHELSLIRELKYEAYFLTVYDLVQFARSRGILCQGRGSAANSAVCYYIGITSVNPAEIDLLFERFISKERDEPPDIDVDFEHERREEVIQYVYQKYGRDRAGMCATLITYRGRSAIRDVGKAMGLSLDQVDSMAKRLDWWHRGALSEEEVRDAGVDPNDPTVQRTIALVTELLGFPRHLGQHTGGMIMTRGLLSELVPIENASMEDRTVVEWDKDDVEELGLLKVDVLGLGMLTCISKAFRFLEKLEEREANEHESSRIHESSRRVGVSPTILQEMQSTENTESTEDTEKCIQDFRRVGLRRVQSSRVSPTDLKSWWARRPPYGALTKLQTGHAKENNTKNFSVFSVPSVLSKPRKYELHTLSPTDPAVYDMICKADTIGVFQIESRAQMSMLPRLRPREFYDLVIEVAIVRPGPIQGNMVHPYLRRRCGDEKVTFPSAALENVLKKTLGVPLFQEQAMKVVMVAAGFSAGEADQLRRAMAAWRKNGAINKFHHKIINGMLANGYTREFAESTFQQIQGFGEYGFPESHSASFALLVYVSAWIKCHHPAVFCAALLNSQPMGFYAPAQIVRDAREHGVEVRPVDVNWSGWDCRLSPSPPAGEGWGEGKTQSVNSRENTNRSTTSTPLPNPLPQGERGPNHPAVRLGFREIKGFSQTFARQIEVARKDGPFRGIADFHLRTGLPKKTLEKLAEADAFGSLGLTRRQALWHVLELDDAQMPLFQEDSRHEGTKARRHEGVIEEEGESKSLLPVSLDPASCLRASVPACLPAMPLAQEVRIDYQTTSLSLKKHPVALIRETLGKQRILTSKEVNSTPAGRWVKVAGLVLVRQRPGTASGIVFITLEDETGVVNLIVRPNIWEKYHAAARHAGLLQCDGYVERQGEVVHLMAKRLFDRSEMIGGYEVGSRDFH